jgi:hypothetical protein
LHEISALLAEPERAGLLSLMRTDGQDVADASQEDQNVVDLVPALPGWLEIYQAQQPRRVPQSGPTLVEQVLPSLLVVNSGFSGH